MRSKNSYVLAIVIKLIYLGLWIAVIALFLYLPLMGLFGTGKRTLNILPGVIHLIPIFLLILKKKPVSNYTFLIIKRMRSC